MLHTGRTVRCRSTYIIYLCISANRECWRSIPAQKRKLARKIGNEEIEIYLNEQVTAFTDFVMGHVPHYIVETFLHRQCLVDCLRKQTETCL